MYLWEKGLNKTSSKQTICYNAKIQVYLPKEIQNSFVRTMLRARTFRVRRKSLRAHYAHAYERTCNFIRSRKGTFLLNG